MPRLGEGEEQAVEDGSPDGSPIELVVDIFEGVDWVVAETGGIWWICCWCEVEGWEFRFKLVKFANVVESSPLVISGGN
jgi:hypothetical protein